MDYFRKLLPAEPIINNLPEPVEVLEAPKPHKRRREKRRMEFVRESSEDNEPSYDMQMDFWDVIDRIGDNMGGFLTDDEARNIVTSLQSMSPLDFRICYHHFAGVLHRSLRWRLDLSTADKKRVVSHVISMGKNEYTRAIVTGEMPVDQAKCVSLDRRLPEYMHL